MFLFFACSSDKTKDIPDVSNVSVETNVYRFDQALFSLDTNNLLPQLAALENKDTAFTQIFFRHILGSKGPRASETTHPDFVKGFITFDNVRHLYDTTQVVYGDFTEVENQFAQAFQFFKYYFPNRDLPTITTFISEYSYAAFIYGDNQLAVGLDFFLGSDYPYGKYNPGNPNFSNYLLRTFNKDHLVLKTLQPLIDDMVGPPAGNQLLDYMVNSGKKMYLLDQLLPYHADTIITEWSAAQLNWVTTNEADIWAHFISEDLLYSTDYSAFRKLVEYSPNSPGMPKDAPGRTAVWTGFRMVEAYMERTPSASLEDLIRLKDAQKILEESRYRPQR